MYTLPRDYKCIKCGFETKFGPHDRWDKSPITETGHPVCPKCWNEFLTSFGATMLRSEAWSKDGSEYDQHMKAKTK